MNHAMAWGAPFAGGATIAPRATVRSTLTHEQFCHAVRDAILATATLDVAETARIAGAKMVYGIGDGGYRGVCHYQAWDKEHCMVEIAATGEESATQLAGTTTHELGHVLAGHGAGHGPEWRAACARLGLNDAKATGHVYTQEGFSAPLGAIIATLGEPNDGKPSFGHGFSPVTLGTVKPCPMGRGTRGGKSRGKGSGSRLRLWICGHGQKVRVASDKFDATCNVCSTPFTYAGT